MYAIPKLESTFTCQDILSKCKVIKYIYHKLTK